SELQVGRVQVRLVQVRIFHARLQVIRHDHLVSGEATSVSAGAYVLQVGGNETTTGDPVMRPIQLQPGRSYTLTFDLPTVYVATKAPVVNRFVLLIMAVIVIALSGGMIIYFRH